MTQNLPFSAPPHGYLTLRLDALNSMAKELAGRQHEKATGLSLREVRILLIVREHPGISITHLIKRSYLEKTIVSRCVTHLSKLGLACRNLNEEDSRQFSLTLTKKGHATATLSAQIATDFIARMMSVLSTHENAVLDIALEKMIALMHAEFDGDSPHLTVKKPPRRPPGIVISREAKNSKRIGDNDGKRAAAAAAKERNTGSGGSSTRRSGEQAVGTGELPLASRSRSRSPGRRRADI